MVCNLSHLWNPKQKQVDNLLKLAKYQIQTSQDQISRVYSRRILHINQVCDQIQNAFAQAPYDTQIVILGDQQITFIIKTQMFKISIAKSLKDCESVGVDQIPIQEFQDQMVKHKQVRTDQKGKQKLVSWTPSREPSINFQKAIKQSEQSLSTTRLRWPQIDRYEHGNSINQKKPNDSVLQFKSKNMYKRFQKKKLKQKLKDTISMQKVNILKQNFIQKLRRNNIYCEPLTQDQAYNIKPQPIWNIRGIQISEKLSIILNSLFILNIIVMVFISSITVPFAELKADQNIKMMEMLGLIIYFVEIALNLITVRFSLGRKLETLKEISQDYFKQAFYVDITSFIIALLNAATDSQIQLFNIGKVFIVFKMPDWFQKIKKLEVQLIKNYYKEQYWSLMKVFLFNFLYAHLLSIVLLCIADVNEEKNWLINKGIQDTKWNEQYIWSYYWSTTIMLTIGFGDIVPACYQEACLMIFIQTISCVILAYNINCVGTLISNIRMQDEEKHKNLKIFKKLAEKNKVTQELTWKINNFIQEHSNIKKLTNIEQQAKFIESLPSNYKVEYLKQSNKNIFKKVYFFSSLMQKTLFALAQNIKAKIAHPLEVLLSNQTNFDLLILKYGEIACKSNKLRDMKFKGELFNRVKIQQSHNPFLLHTNFITKQRSNFRVISTVYSLIYFLSFQKLVSAFKECESDYQLYSQMKDKCKYHIDEFQVFQCKHCDTRHTSFDCPKYHFIPIKQHVIHKELTLQKIVKNQRQPEFQRKVKNSEIFLINIQSQNTINSKSSYPSNPAERKKALIANKALWKNRNQLTPPSQTQNDRQLRTKQFFKGDQKLLYQQLAQALKIHLTKMIGGDKGEDQVWLIQTDKMNNFKKYFSDHNPQKLGERLHTRKRKSKHLSTYFSNVQKDESVENSSVNQMKSIEYNQNELIAKERTNEEQYFSHKFIRRQKAKKQRFTVLIGNSQQFEELNNKFND